jgi:hypothetical protein
MEKLKLSTIDLMDLKRYVTLIEKPGIQYDWLDVDDIQLSDREQHYLMDLQTGLQKVQVHLFNEATLWSRAIYPLLQLAEQDNIQIWAEVGLSAKYAQFELEGIADGVMGPSFAGRIQCPYFVMVETKRGVENTNPIFQLYGQLLAAAWLNDQVTPQDTQEIFGCFTIADSWTFVRADVSAIASDRPTLTVEFSPEYAEKFDAPRILRILKTIIVNAQTHKGVKSF